MSRYFEDHRVLTIIRGHILEGDLAPDAPLGPATLANDLVVSAAPIRDALFRLCERGLVRHVEGKGFFVSRPTAQECVESGYLILKLTKLGFERHRSNQVDALPSVPDQLDWFERALRQICTRSTLKHARAASDVILLRLKQMNRASAIRQRSILGQRVVSLMRQQKLTAAEGLIGLAYTRLIEDCREQLVGDLGVSEMAI